MSNYWNNNGKYQVAVLGSNEIVVLNTETGVMKTYYDSSDNNYWNESSGTITITFTH